MCSTVTVTTLTKQKKDKQKRQPCLMNNQQLILGYIAVVKYIHTLNVIIRALLHTHLLKLYVFFCYFLMLFL